MGCFSSKEATSERTPRGLPLNEASVQQNAPASTTRSAEQLEGSKDEKASLKGAEKLASEGERALVDSSLKKHEGGVDTPDLQEAPATDISGNKIGDTPEETKTLSGKDVGLEDEDSPQPGALPSSFAHTTTTTSSSPSQVRNDANVIENGKNLNGLNLRGFSLLNKDVLTAVEEVGSVSPSNDEVSGSSTSPSRKILNAYDYTKRVPASPDLRTAESPHASSLGDQEKKSEGEKLGKLRISQAIGVVDDSTHTRAPHFTEISSEEAATAQIPMIPPSSSYLRHLIKDEDLKGLNGDDGVFKGSRGNQESASVRLDKVSGYQENGRTHRYPANELHHKDPHTSNGESEKYRRNPLVALDASLQPSSQYHTHYDSPPSSSLHPHSNHTHGKLGGVPTAAHPSYKDNDVDASSLSQPCDQGTLVEVDISDDSGFFLHAKDGGKDGTLHTAKTTSQPLSPTTNPPPYNPLDIRGVDESLPSPLSTVMKSASRGSSPLLQAMEDEWVDHVDHEGQKFARDSNGNLVKVAKFQHSNGDTMWMTDSLNQMFVTNEEVVKLLPADTLEFIAVGLLNANVEQQSFEEKGVDALDEGLSRAVNNLPNQQSLLGYVCKKGLKREQPNQDDFFILRTKEFSLYCVCDGHGPHGQFVSDFVVQILPYCTLKNLHLHQDIPELLNMAFSYVNHTLWRYAKMNDVLEVAMSGTTATLVFHEGNYLHVAYVGDSTAVIGRRTPDGDIVGLPLTRDHKPTSPEEEARILAHGGEVRLMEGDVPHRVFVKGCNFPGLAMSRAIGDFLGATIGVTWVPDVVTYEIQPDDLFLIVSSDGVWEFIGSNEAAAIVCEYKKEHVQLAVEKLADIAWSRWIKEEEIVVDDITSIIYWF